MRWQSHKSGRAVGCLTAALLLMSVAGCASPSRPRADAKKPEPSAVAGIPPGLNVTPAFAPVVQAAFQQARRPLAEASLLPAPPGTPENLAAPLPQESPEGKTARLTLAE